MAKRNSNGKIAENKVRAYLKKLATHPDHWWHRFPDAGVCRGRLPKQPADFMAMYRGRMTLLEVKEVASADKVPVSRLTQLPKMRRFIMAGGSALFIFWHYNHRHWRVVDVRTIPEDIGASLDLTPWETMEELAI